MITYTPLYPGTLVKATLGGHTAYGTVELYEHHSPNQTTFPVFVGCERPRATEVLGLLVSYQCPGLAYYFPVARPAHGAPGHSAGPTAVYAAAKARRASQ